MIQSTLSPTLIVAAAGALGAVARWGTSKAAQALLGPKWPVGTLVVNVVGCFVFGLVVALLRHDPRPESNARLLWLTGFCGAYTTFSTFAFDVIELEATRGLSYAAANVGLHLTLGLGGLLLGLAAARLF